MSSRCLGSDYFESQIESKLNRPTPTGRRCGDRRSGCKHD